MKPQTQVADWCGAWCACMAGALRETLGLQTHCLVLVTFLWVKDSHAIWEGGGMTSDEW